MKLHNAQSLAFYQYLMDDTQKEIDYWKAQPDDDVKTAQLDTFNKLYAEHQANFDRVKLQGDNDGADWKAELEEVIEWFELLIKNFGQWLPDGTKQLFTKIINAAKKVLETIFK